MFDGFTDNARAALGLARQAALDRKHDAIGSEHILFGLLDLKQRSVAASVLRNLEVTPRALRAFLQKRRTPGPAEVPSLGQQVPFTPIAKAILESAATEALTLRHDYIGSEHLLLGLLVADEGLGYEALRAAGLTVVDARAEVEDLLGGPRPEGRESETLSPGPEAPGQPVEGDLSKVFERALESLEAVRQRPTSPHKSNTPALDSFTRDVIEGVVEADDPFVDRDDLVGALATAFARRDQPHALLVGDEGVGRDAIVRAFAVRAAALPEPPRIRELDLNLLVAGTRYRGQLEERIQAIGVEAQRVGDVILYLPDFASFLSWPLPEGDDERPFRLFAPFLRRGELRCVGRISRVDHERLVASDPSVSRLFQPIPVTAATTSLTCALLAAHRPRLEAHHGIAIHPDAIQVAARLTPPSDLAQPGAALQLLDHACARLATRASRDRPPAGPRPTLAPAEVVTAAAEEVTARAATRAPDSLERAGLTGVLGTATPALEAGLVLVLLPPGAAHARVFHEAIEPALTALKLRAQVLDDPYRLGGSLEPLWRDLHRAEVVLADASGRDPGVACAVGLALGAGRRPLLLVHDPGDLPAGLRGLSPLRYDPLDLVDLRERLERLVSGLRRPSA